MELTQEYLKSIISYNSETGILTWKKRTDVRQCWNDRFAGKKAGCKRKDGYIVFAINNKLYLAHTIAFFIHYGVWPEEIDHDNRVRDDNRIVNLISTTPLMNNKNMPIRKTNTSGHIGVNYYKSRNKWVAYITVNKKTKCLGYFDNKDDAINIRKKAETEHGFHPNHGK